MDRKRSLQDKVKALDELAAVTAQCRQRGETVVHCHGVFDLLHIGHIRHLNQARRLGDVLVVTLTPDRYVNKGPHRPVFEQQLRAEAIAALDAVDYVAINEWPTAVETVTRLRPDIYAKGPDYRESAQDLTGGIDLERQAVESQGGRLAITEDITFSSSNLINRHLSGFAPEVQNYLADFGKRYPAEEIIASLEALRPMKVVVVGDAIIDEYQYCEAIGKSSKEPTLVVRHLSTERFAGGALAIANHIASFVDQVSLVTFFGSEKSHEGFVRERLADNIDLTALYRTEAPTVLKRRFIESYFSTKMFEIYELDDRRLDDRENSRLCQTLLELLPHHDLVVVADFGHGLMSQQAIELAMAKAKFLAVNAQSNAANLGYHAITKYRRADYVCLTEGELRLEARDRHSDLGVAMLDLARRMNLKCLSVTQGKHGCTCYNPSEGMFKIPALAGRVVDRVGAGDAFLSVSALCAAAGIPTEVTGFVGNLAGAQAVAIVGNRSSIERVPLYKHVVSVLK